jgi:hypothetical protein
MEWFVEWGLAHRQLSGVESIGVDEIHCWFRARGEISSGAVEGLNSKIRVVTRRSYRFRTFEAMEVARYHTLGHLPELESPHRFC